MTEKEANKGFVYTDRDGDRVLNWPKIIKTAVIALVVLIAVIIIWPVVIIGPTQRGVIITLGQVDLQKDPLLPGAHFKIPIIQKIKKYDLTPSKVTIDIRLGASAALSSDKQSIGVNGEVIWKYDENLINKLATSYADDGKFRNDVAGAIETAVRNTLGKHNINDIVKEQDQIADESSALANDRIKEAGYPATIVLLNLSNWDWSDDYDQMIRETQNMSQQAEKAKQQLVLVEQTSQQQVTEAEAKARASIAEAEGRKESAALNAEAAVITAKGEKDSAIERALGIAETNRLIQQNLSIMQSQWKHDEQMAYYNKWNGKEVPESLVWTPAGPMSISTGR